MVFLRLVRVDRHVVREGGVADLQREVRVGLPLLGERRRHGVYAVELAALERGEHRVGVLVDGEADGIDVRRRAVVARVLLQDRRALLVEGLDVEGAAANLRAATRGIPRLEALAVGAHDRLHDVLRQDEELLQLRQHIRGGLVVGDHDRRVVRRLELRGMRKEWREHGSRAVGVFDDQVAGEGGIGRRHRLAVRPRAAGLELERPDLAVARRGPRVGPVAHDLVVLVVLDERGVGLGPEDVGQCREAHEGVDRVGV